MAPMNNYHCIWLASIFILGSLASQATSRSLQDEMTYQRYEQWMSSYGRTYADSIEKEARFKIFKDNVAYIASSNNMNKAYKLRINEYADLTNDEFKTTMTGFKGHMRSNKVVSFKYENVTSVPRSVDWRKKGAVTPVKSQGNCGCCWAFSAVAATEGINKIKTGKLISLSEQELVDCDRKVNNGCQGGYMSEAFKYIVENNGINAEASYPYKGTDGTCNAGNAKAAKITGFQDVPANSESALLKALANQPISVAIDVGGHDFQFYSSGVFTGQCGTELNHGVTAVGYGTSSDGTKYWLVKNSWGDGWGMKGYFMLERGISDAQGKCGIAMGALYPTA